MVKGIALVTASAITACALLAQGPPDNRCASDQDCFRAQGEVCNLTTHRCEPGPDAGAVDAPNPDAQ